MNKKDFTGWQDVFRFSFVQGVKAKAFLVSVIVLCVLILVGIPGFTWFANRGEKPLGDTEIETLYVYDETGLPISYDKVFEDARYASLRIETASAQSFEDRSEAMETAEDSKEAAVRITYEPEGYFQLNYVKAAGSSFSDKDYEALTDEFTEFFTEAKREAVEITPEQTAFINRPVSTNVELTSTNENGETVIAPKEKGEGLSMGEYNLFLFVIIGVMMIINIAGSQIANGIVTEKSSRVIEYLMINVRPLALIVGKILASLLMVVIQFACMGVAYGVASVISTLLFGDNLTKNEESAAVAFLQMVKSISALQLIEAIAVVLVGVLFFCILAGLAGASVSKIEELAEGMKIYQMCLIIGCYVGMGICIAQMSGSIDKNIINALCIIPISAPFVIPANLLMGKIGLTVGLVGLIVLIVMTALLFLFTSKVYESMIFYNGSVLKFKDILQIAKNRGKSGKEAK